jgi:hypothetical protein
MSELIAIPLESDRRAAAVLAALRRLQAEYEGEVDRSGASAGGTASPPDARPGRLWRAWHRARWGALASLIGGAAVAAVAAVALLSAAAVSGTPTLPFPLAGVPGALVAAAGVRVGAAAGEKHRALRRRAGAPAAADAPLVSWLVAYVMRDGVFVGDGASPGGGRVRASVLQVTLPAGAEERLKAILARADAATAR